MKFKVAYSFIIPLYFLLTPIHAFSQPLSCDGTVVECRGKISLEFPVVDMLGPGKIYPNIPLKDAINNHVFAKVTLEDFGTTEIIGAEPSEQYLAADHIFSFQVLGWPRSKRISLDQTKKLIIRLNNAQLPSTNPAAPGVLRMTERDGFWLQKGQQYFMWLDISPEIDYEKKAYRGELIAGFGGIYVLNPTTRLLVLNEDSPTNPLFELGEYPTLSNVLNALAYDGHRETTPRRARAESAPPKPCTTCIKDGVQWNTGKRSSDPARSNDMIIDVRIGEGITEEQYNALSTALAELNSPQKIDGKTVTTGFYFQIAPSWSEKSDIIVKLGNDQGAKTMQVVRTQNNASILLPKDMKVSHDDLVGNFLNAFGRLLNLAPTRQILCHSIMNPPNANGSRRLGSNIMNPNDILAIRNANSTARTTMCTETRTVVDKTAQNTGDGGGIIVPGSEPVRLTLTYSTCVVIIERTEWYSCGSLASFLPGQPIQPEFLPSCNLIGYSDRVLYSSCSSASSAAPQK